MKNKCKGIAKVLEAKGNKIQIYDQESFNDGIERIGNDYNDFDVFVDMCENMRCNGEMLLLDPEDVGALTDSIIFTTDYEYLEEELNQVKIYNLWWYPNYQLHNLIEKLVEDGELEFDVQVFEEGQIIDNY